MKIGVLYRVIGPAFLAALTAQGGTYYVDSAGGNDANAGTATNTAWQSVARVNATTFAPGDVILFKAGGSWLGPLNPKGSGAAGNPIVIDRYGDGNKPLIDGNGVNGTGTTGGGAVFLYNQEYWEINNLEIVNDATSDGERRGIHIAASNFGTVDHIHIKNCHIHDIRGRLSTSDGDLVAKRTGGIIVETISDSSVATRFVTNVAGSITSAVATLTVNVPSSSSSGGVVMAELYNGGGKTGATFNRDFVVLKNTSGAATNLVNWSLQHLKNGGWQTPFVLTNVTLPPGGFHLIQCYYDGGAAGGLPPVADSVTPQTSVWNFSTSGGGTVSLVEGTNMLTSCASAGIMDLAGWLTTATNCFEGAAGLAPGGATQSNQRRAGGCQDTDSNTNDFALATPTGRNAGTAPAPCGSAAPDITSQPVSRSVYAGASVSFSVTATGSAPLSYQWRKGGVAIGGATSATYGLSGVSTNDAGSLDVVVTNAFGAVTSAVATLAVATAGTNSPVNPADYINPRFANVTVTSGVKFADVLNYQGMPTSLFLDVYQPTGDTNTSRPAIVWIHGGGFRTGSSRTQSYIVTYATEFAKRGYVCFSIDYRLRSGSDMPTQESELPAEQDGAADCNTAFAWLRSNATAYAINTNWLFVAGGSAGGRIANVFSFHEGPDTNVCPTCSWAVLTNGVNTVPLVDWNRAGLIANASLWGAPEPVMRWYVLQSNDTPTVIIHGTADATIEYQNALDLYAGMTNAGATAELNPLVGYGHTPTSANSQIIPWIANFFAAEWTKKLAPVAPPPAVVPPQLTNVLLNGGGLQFAFTNVPGASFTVLRTTNLLVPNANWQAVGPVVEGPSGFYTFTDTNAVAGQRFYQVRSP